MAVVMILKNSRTLDPLCNWTAYRYERSDPGLDVLTPCALCLRPGVEQCNGVVLTRVYTYDASESTWGKAGDIHLAGSTNDDVALTYDSGEVGCVWNGQNVYERSSGDEFTETLDLALAISINSGDPTKIDLTLTVGITVAPVGSVPPAGSHSIDYTLTAVDPSSLGPFVLTTAETLLWDMGSGYSITFPASITLTAV